jgi:hypothetical protein
MSGSGNVFALGADQIEVFWPYLEPHLKRVERETATVSVEGLKALALNCEAQVWGVQDARGNITGACITRVYETPNGRFCTVFVAAGILMPALPEGIALIEDWARGLGCRAIEIIGRRGWQRVLPGYEPRAVVLEKNLIGELH